MKIRVFNKKHLILTFPTKNFLTLRLAQHFDEQLNLCGNLVNCNVLRWAQSGLAKWLAGGGIAWCNMVQHDATLLNVGADALILE